MLLGQGWLSLCFLWATDASWAVPRLFLPDMIYRFPLLLCHTSLPAPALPKGLFRFLGTGAEMWPHSRF